MEGSESSREFVNELRSASIYPSFRAFVRMIYWLFLLLALTSAVVGLVAATGSGGALSIVFGLGGAVVFYIVATVSREASLMIADLCDASVLLAMRRDR